MSCGIQAMARVVISAVWVLHTSATDTTANVRSAPPSGGLTGSELAEHLVARVEEAVARGLDTDVAQHVEELKDALRPTYSALPKNSVGKVDITNLKHALRRFFVHRKGWHISALVPEIAANVDGAEDLTQLDNASEAQVVMKSLFELSPGENGFDLHKLGVLATVIEQLIVEEAVGKLRVAYTAKKHNVDSVLTPAQAEDVLALYLAAYIRGRDVAKIPRAQLLKFERLTVKTFPNWVHIRKRMMDVLRNLFHDTHELSFQKVARVAEEVTHRFADWQNEQCQATKGHLLELEDDTTRGRVRLTEFYDAALTKGMYQFTESINYLRQIGALDESDELDPRVVVPNYISGPSNCVARQQLVVS